VPGCLFVAGLPAEQGEANMPGQKNFQSTHPRRHFFSMAMAVAACYTNGASAVDSAQWVKGRVLVQPRAGLNAQQLDAILKPHGGRVASRIPQLNVHIC
jgi:hypothetical protein